MRDLARRPRYEESGSEETIIGATLQVIGYAALTGAVVLALLAITP